MNMLRHWVELKDGPFIFKSVENYIVPIGNLYPADSTDFFPVTADLLTSPWQTKPKGFVFLKTRQCQNRAKILYFSPGCLQNMVKQEKITKKNPQWCNGNSAWVFFMCCFDTYKKPRQLLSWFFFFLNTLCRQSWFNIIMGTKQKKNTNCQSIFVLCVSIWGKAQ